MELSTTEIGRIRRVGLRKVWEHEAYDFTTWLEDNLDVLNEVLDVTLSSASREQSAGSFNVDLLAETDEGGLIVIENQLERSNHDHLGKLLTYFNAFDARGAVWIVSSARPEHVNVVTWLNETSAESSFYLIKVEAITIGDSPPAPLLTEIVGPSEEARQVGEAKKELAERHYIREEFWTELLEQAHKRSQLHANISPSRYSWVSTGAGISGLSYNYTVRQHDAGVELYIDRGKGAEEENLRIFEQLHEHKEDVEEVFGEPLDWQPLEGRRSCRIEKRIELGGYRDREMWPDAHEAMVDAMTRLEEALRPHVRELKRQV